MRYGIIGDIHSNLEALDTVLKALEGEDLDQTICVGDIVGYGAYPSECLARIRELDVPSVAGNHDYAAVDMTSIEYFNPDARNATLWTREHLSAEDKDYLATLPLTMEFEDFVISHGTLHSPELFDYIQTVYDAHLSFQILETSICFLGHSHVPITFFDDDPISYFMEPEIPLSESEKLLVNVGSVGQPRDQDPRAAYAVYDTDDQIIWIKRLEYDIQSAAEKILEAGLPKMNAERLAHGR